MKFVLASQNKHKLVEISEILEKLDAEGMPTVAKGEYTGGRYAYIDSVDQLTMMLELLEND